MIGSMDPLLLTELPMDPWIHYCYGSTTLARLPYMPCHEPLGSLGL